MEKMQLIGSRITSIEGKRNQDFSGEVSISTSIQIISFDSIPEDSSTLKTSYSFKVDYRDLGNVLLHGIIFVKTTSETVESLKSSLKEKQIEMEEHAHVTNMIIQKASIKAFELEEELGLPIHMSLPQMQIKKND